MKIYRRFPFAYPSDDAWSSFVLFLLSVFAQNNTRSDGPTNWELHVNFTLCSAVLYNNFELFSLNARDSLEFSCEKFIDNSFRHRMTLSNQCIPQSLFSGKYVIRSICPSADETTSDHRVNQTCGALLFGHHRLSVNDESQWHIQLGSQSCLGGKIFETLSGSLYFLPFEREGFGNIDVKQ